MEDLINIPINVELGAGDTADVLSTSSLRGHLVNIHYEPDSSAPFPDTFRLRVTTEVFHRLLLDVIATGNERQDWPVMVPAVSTAGVPSAVTEVRIPVLNERIRIEINPEGSLSSSSSASATPPKGAVHIQIEVPTGGNRYVG